MGTCIICGASAEGQICPLHEEDVAFEFEGTRPDQLTPSRYYRGIVDGYADFGVFVEIGESGVTGLLHQSELRRRLESLPWEPGDEVYVQVTKVHDNGNVDLGWSIRQSAEEFRGRLVDDPSAETNAELPSESSAEDAATDQNDSSTADTNAGDAAGDAGGSTSQRADAATDGSHGEATRSRQTRTSGGQQLAQADGEAAVEQTSAQPDGIERVTVGALADRVGDVVRLEGEITGARQTGGPTVFELTDETGTVDCAAFEEAGVRAYPEVDAGDVVRLTGEVERRRGDLQVETAALKLLEGDEHGAVEARLEDAIVAEAEPTETALLADDPVVEAVRSAIVESATTIRRAIIESRPVILRHAATVDGYVAGAAIERAVLPLVREHHAAADAQYHYVDRRPLDDAFYDMNAATGDVTTMLDNAERHDEKLPLFVFVAAGSTHESLDGFELLSTYDAGRVVVDGGHADPEISDAVDAVVNPTLADADHAQVTTAVLGANLAAMVNADVRADLRHLPAVSYWQDTPEAYRELAADAGYDAEGVRDLREAIALEAYYQSYEDKREIVKDLLWDAGNASLAAHVSGQFRTKLETELETAAHHVEDRLIDGVRFRVLDTEAYTHRFDFPPIDLLLDELHRRDDGPRPLVTVGFNEDELRLRSTVPVDVRAVAAAVADEVPTAGVTPRGSRDGRIEFLLGEREAVLEATIGAIAARL